MKELNTFRKFINEGPDDIDILGKKFNFNDICPGAHKAISDLADEYENNDIKLGDVLFLANLHQDFFNLEKKALGPQGIDVDELNKIKQLYVEILNIAVNSFGTDTMQEIETYMKMHMDKIKKAGLKASEPGGSSDTSYAQDWADEQDAMYGKASFVEEEELEENDKALDEVLEEQITPDELRKEFYKGMQIMDSALAKAKGTIPQEQWDALYAVVTKVEDVAEYIGE